MVAVREIMEWYVESGVDILLEDHPVDRFAEMPPPPRQSAAVNQSQPASSQVPSQVPSPAQRLAQMQEGKPQARPVQTAQATVPDGAAIEQAQALAEKAQSLEELKHYMAGFEGCNLKRTAKSMVFADGNPQSGVMLIGEAPGRDEDIQGLPFVGRAGQLLDRMLAAIELDRDKVYITNVIPWRPPGNRTPSPQETEICRPFIERHIELVNPDLVLMLGGSSAKTLMKTTDGIMKLRGKWSEISTRTKPFKALPTLHPAYLLRQPAHKRLVWQDLLSFKLAMINDTS